MPSNMAKPSVVSTLTISALAFQQRSPLAVSHIPDNLASLSKLGEWNAKGNFKQNTWESASSCEHI